MRAGCWAAVWRSGWHARGRPPKPSARSCSGSARTIRSPRSRYVACCCCADWGRPSCPHGARHRSIPPRRCGRSEKGRERGRWARQEIQRAGRVTMHRLRALWIRLVHAKRNRRAFEAELEAHLALDIENGVRSGLSASQARRQALVRYGGLGQARQTYRERAGLPLVETILQDGRYALRGLRRNPLFAVTAILTLALGIGATAAVFSVVDRILFRSLPYAHPDRLVSVGLTAPIIPQEFLMGSSYYTWRDNQTPFSAFTSETGVNACDLTEHNPAHLGCASVEANFLPALGVAPILGRNFLPEEDRPNGPRVALISYSLWTSHYGRDPAIVNRQLDIDGSQVRVIGVLPADFEMPALEQADILVPQALDEAEQRKADPGRVMYAFARLKPGITIAQAEEQLRPVFNYSLSLAPQRFRSEVHLRVRSVRDR